MCVCVCVCVRIMGVYMCVFKQIFLKMKEHCLLFLILFFQDSLLYFYCRNLDNKEIVPYLLPKRFRPNFWSSSGIV